MKDSNPDLVPIIILSCQMIWLIMPRKICSKLEKVSKLHGHSFYTSFPEFNLKVWFLTDPSVRRSRCYKQEDPILCLVYFETIIPTTCIISLITIIPAFYKYIKSYNNKKINVYIGLIDVFPTIFLSIIIIILYSIWFCREIQICVIFANILTLLYVGQILLLIAILFTRLYFVFDETSFALSKTTIKLYWIFYALSIVMFLVAGIGISNFGPTITVFIISAFATLLLIVMLVILVSLFLYKMIQVYRYTYTKETNDPTLVKIITKTSVVAIISILATGVDLIAAIIASTRPPVYFEILSFLLITFDVSTNFWCIVLSYNGYTKWYLKMCG